MRLKKSLSLLLVVVVCATSFSFFGGDSMQAQELFTKGSIVYFGKYIQDKVTDTNEIKYLNKQMIAGETKTINGVKVAAKGSYDNPSFYIEAPLGWKIIGERNGSYILLSEKIIKQGWFNSSIGWPDSEIRSWLNGDFYKNAFNLNEKNDIVNTQLDNVVLNFVLGEGYFKKNETTIDKVWLLDEHEILDSNFGFSSSDEASSTRRAKASQYVDDNEDYSDWYVRGEPYWFWYNSAVGKYVQKDGALHKQGGVMDGSAGGFYDHGFRPVICVKKDSKNVSKTKPIIKLNINNSNNIKNQYSLKTEVTGRFFDGGTEKYITDKEIYDDNFFLVNKSTTANGNLAKMSMLVAASEYDAGYAESIMKQCRFINRKNTVYPYKKSKKTHKKKKQEIHKVTYNVGIKIVHGTPIIAVWIRGTAKNSEWKGNWEIGKKGKVHYGFKVSEKALYKDFIKYLNSKKINIKNSKIWITGHSRGAAIANIFAKRMSDKIGKSKVYAYTFATPRVVKEKKNGVKNYSNIMNYLNPGDFVTEVAPEDWGFNRYGKDITLSKQKKTLMKKIFKKKSGKKYDGYGVKGKQSMVTAFLTYAGMSRKGYFKKKPKYTPRYYCKSGLGNFLGGHEKKGAKVLTKVCITSAKATYVTAKLGIDGTKMVNHKFHHAHTQLSYLSWLKAQY